MEDLKKLIAENIIKYRKQAGLTQYQLAEKLNYSDKAVSKWERGDSLPDIIVLKEMSTLFGISLDTLTSQKEEVECKPIKKILMHIHTSKMLITSVASVIVWLVATLVFISLSLFSVEGKIWLSFIYAIPVNLIVLLALAGIWKNKWYNFTCVSLLSLSIALSLQLSINYENIWLFFVLCVPIIILAFFLFIFRTNIFHIKRKKNKSNKTNS